MFNILTMGNEQTSAQFKLIPIHLDTINFLVYSLFLLIQAL